VDRRVAQGHPPDSPADRPTDRWIDHPVELAVGLGLVVLALGAYLLTGAVRSYDPYYTHFLWQAEAFLHGRAAIDFPVTAVAGSIGNDLFNDVMPLPGGGALLPFPPLPAIVLMPFVAIWGLATNDQIIAAVLGAIDVAIAWWMLGRLRVSLGSRVATTLFFALGTVIWYAAELGTTWFFAHLVAVAFALLAVGVAIGRDPDSVRDEDELPEAGDETEATTRRSPRQWLAAVDRWQLLAGFLLGLAATARLPVVLGAPFFVLVGGGGSWVRRAVSAGIGAAVPVGALLVYNLAASGAPMHAAYDYQYRLEATGYPSLGYHDDWGIEDPRYLPQNVGIALLSPPVLFPDTVPRALGGEPLCTDPDAKRGLFDETCPLLLPPDTGMSLFLTSPAYLLAIPALRLLYGRSRLVTGAALAVLVIAVFDLMHFSQGWVQFGWRFSNDFVPFALPLVALGIERLRHRPVVVAAFVAASVAVNLWGVMWGTMLGW